VAGTCKNCHNGTKATGQPAGHWSTTLSCDACHNTVSWNTITHRHTSANYPGDHRVTIACTTCHSTNADTVPYRTPAYKPDCAGCHANDYKPGEHRNATVSTLRNCAGTCHKSTPEHRVTDRSF